jgi:hypothetical protein
MRDPVHRFDPVEVEADIVDTRRFLKDHVESESWNADPDGRASNMHATIDEVEASNLPDWAKDAALWALLEQTKKRPARKPTRHRRDHTIQEAAARLVITRGYKPTRNDVTRGTASAASIIHQALDRLGEKLSEKSINAIVTRGGADNFIKHKVSPAFYEYLREHASGLLYRFECDPNAPDPKNWSGPTGRADIVPPTK